MRKWILLLVVFSLTFSCDTLLKTRNLDFEVIKNSEYGAEKQEQHRLITNQETYAKIHHEIFSNQSPIPALKEIDFDKKNVIFIHLGTYSYGGNSFTVQSVHQKKDELEVLLDVKTPNRNEPVLTMMTYPFLLIEIDKPKNKIQHINIIKHKK